MNPFDFKKHRPLLFAVLAFALFWGMRFPVSVGPLHDEAITMLAAKGMEREYASAGESGRRPFGEIVPASEWHKFTSDYSLLSFSAIRNDVSSCDMHPPLAFWTYNLWLSLSEHGAYRHALVLSGIQIALAGLVIYLCVWRLTRSCRLAGLGALIFYLTNSALFTALYVRQYALLTLWVALSVLVIIHLLREENTKLRNILCGVLLASVCLAGMLTQYLFAVVTMPLQFGLVFALFTRRDWRRLGIVLAAYCLSATALYLLTPEALPRALHNTQQGGLHAVGIATAVSRIMSAFFPMPAFLPRYVAIAAGAVFFGLLVCIAAMSWRVEGERFQVICARLVGTGGVVAIALQIILVAVGVFPGWATGAAYLSPLAVLLAVVLPMIAFWYPRRIVRAALTCLCVAMAVSQAAYVFRRVTTRDLMQIDYARRFKPDLVVIDDTRRGMLLPLTMRMPPNQNVLAADRSVLERALAQGSLDAFSRILFLMEDETNLRRGKAVLSVFEKDGWKIEKLSTMHPNMHDAYVLTHRQYL